MIGVEYHTSGFLTHHLMAWFFNYKFRLWFETTDEASKGTGGLCILGLIERECTSALQILGTTVSWTFAELCVNLTQSRKLHALAEDLVSGGCMA